MNNCPCCSHIMLRHIRNHQLYWFCRNCWQEMPLLEATPVGCANQLRGLLHKNSEKVLIYL
uniref:Uncharacterized protein n=1 Tax=Gloeothece verrucosa (strain PCC 7822) TaxID=497965 RepID=E0ULR2_GLOV7|nr:hypothetical protein [Gloeothece verrucosa]ADN17892.1 hypothetical protein Cyan7822_6045 [Gloeothece verrucosa PCC 7822]